MTRVLAGPVVVLFSGFGLALAGSLALTGEEARVQPVAFNHQVHGKRDIACTDCHEGAESSAPAGLPRVSVCLECHGEDTTTTPEKDRMKAFAAAGREIPWVRLYRLPAHVVFSHERHVALGKLACDLCHGGHGASVAPPGYPEPAVLTMDGCLACHGLRGASLDCLACHK